MLCLRKMYCNIELRLNRTRKPSMCLRSMFVVSVYNVVPVPGDSLPCLRQTSRKRWIHLNVCFHLHAVKQRVCIRGEEETLDLSTSRPWERKQPLQTGCPLFPSGGHVIVIHHKAFVNCIPAGAGLGWGRASQTLRIHTQPPRAVRFRVRTVIPILLLPEGCDEEQWR